MKTRSKIRDAKARPVQGSTDPVPKLTRSHNPSAKSTVKLSSPLASKETLAKLKTIANKGPRPSRSSQKTNPCTTFLNFPPDPASACALQRIELHFFHEQALEVWVAGSFNDWQPEMNPMVSDGNGNWWTELFLAPGIYEYRYVVDDLWVTDPFAARFVINPYGDVNGILTVEMARC
jgi:hypothetical protein